MCILATEIRRKTPKGGVSCYRDYYLLLRSLLEKAQKCFVNEEVCVFTYRIIFVHLVSDLVNGLPNFVEQSENTSAAKRGSVGGLRKFTVRFQKLPEVGI